MIFPAACSLIDSSACWNNLQVPQPSSYDDVGGGGEGNRCLPSQHSGGIIISSSAPIMAAGEAADPPGATTKPMAMSERARLAKVPQPEQGLNCPRCDSTNTKFCYFNNYSLTQPRHFCRACRRYWTRGGALRSVPVGGGYRRHAKRAKPVTKQQQQQQVASAATDDVAHQLPQAAAVAWQHRFADFDMATNLGLSFFPGTTDGGTTMEQQQQQYWRAPPSQMMMHNFPFFHGDQQMATPPSMFHHLGLQMMRGDDGKRGEQLHHQQAAEYPSAAVAAIRASSMHGDVTNNYSSC